MESEVAYVVPANQGQSVVSTAGYCEFVNNCSESEERKFLYVASTVFVLRSKKCLWAAYRGRQGAGPD